MNRKVTGIIGAVVLALVGTLLLVGYVTSAEARAVSGEKLVSVLVVTEKVPVGTSAATLAEKVKTEQVPAKVRADGAIADLDAVEGMYTTVELLPGEQLIGDRFVSSATRAQAGVPSGLLTVTLSLDPERALGGQLRAGDTVGVVASLDPDVPTDAPSISHLMLHKVLVTAVQVDPNTDTSADDDSEGVSDKAPVGKLLVTLAVDAPSVERLVFAAEFGKIWLSAEPTDAPEAGTRIIDGSTIFA